MTAADVDWCLWLWRQLHERFYWQREQPERHTSGAEWAEKVTSVGEKLYKWFLFCENWGGDRIKFLKLCSLKHQETFECNNSSASQWIWIFWKLQIPLNESQQWASIIVLQISKPVFFCFVSQVSTVTGLMISSHKATLDLCFSSWIPVDI